MIPPTAVPAAGQVDQHRDNVVIVAKDLADGTGGSNAKDEGRRRVAGLLIESPHHQKRPSWTNPSG